MSSAAVKSEFATQYKHLCDDEILAIAAQRSTLIPDARLALEDALAERGITPADVDAYVAALDQRAPEPSEFDEYAERFAHCSEDELLHIAGEPLTLPAMMRAALVAEFQRRQVPLPASLAQDAKLASDQP